VLALVAARAAGWGGGGAGALLGVGV